MKKTYLVIGGAGFIGTHLCRYYLQKSQRVICLDNLITGQKNNIQDLLEKKDFTFIRKDISRVTRFKTPVNYVLNFASPASPVDYLKLPLQTLEVGSQGTWNALNIALAHKASFIHASTSEVYGDPDVSPQSESYWGHVNPIGVRSVYDEAKRFSEALVMAYHRVHGLDTHLVRIFNTYGPLMRVEDGRVIPNFISQALLGKPLTVYGDGRQTRSYCHVSDLVRGIDKLLHSRVHTPVNMGNPNERTVAELAQVILKLTRSNSKLVKRPLPSDDPKQRCPDIRVAKSRLGWSPRVDLEQGLIQTIDYFKSTLKV